MTTADGSNSDLINKQLNDAKLNIYNAIKLRRNDILVSLINEWFKKFDTSSEYRYFFNENFCDNNSKSALHLAYELNDYDMVRTLLNFNANPSIKDKIYNKNITELINSSNNQKMKQILNDSLMQSIAQNNLVQIKNFIDSGIDLNSTEGIVDNNSFLHWSVLFGSENVVKYLLDNNANVNILNKFGSTPLHDAVDNRKDSNIIEILLLYKADVNIKATDGNYKNKSPLELSESNKEIHSVIVDFLNETNSEPPMSPNGNEKIPKSDFLPTAKMEYFENFTNYCPDKVNIENKENLYDLLWPKPQLLQINSNEKFYFPNDKNFFVYVKPPCTYKYIDFMNRLTSVYSDIKFTYINKEISEPHIQITIDNNLFNIENSYSITIKKNLITIESYDVPGLQYALCTFLQLCKIYSNSNIPGMKVTELFD